MRIMKATPSIDNANSDPTAGNPGASALRRAWQWLTLIHADDPVRYVLNRGFAHIITIIILFTVLLTLITLTNAGLATEGIVQLSTIPLVLLAWWLNRRGTVYGAGIYVAMCVFATATGLAPSQYAGEHPTVHVAFVFSIVAATLFIRPRAGLWACALQMAALGIALMFSDIPSQQTQLFLMTGSLHLGAFTVFLMVGTTIFSRALRASIAANAELQQLNAELDQRVAARTA